MSLAIEFFFDYGSPYSYLADHRLAKLVEQADLEIAFRPMLLGAVFKATGNQSPMMEPIASKRAYGVVALRRSARIYGAPFETNPNFPINTLMLMRTAVGAQHAGVFEAFHRAVFPAFWAHGLDLGDAAILEELLDSAGLEGARLSHLGTEDAAKRALRANTEEAVARGAFGAPTIFWGDEMYFGADHLFFLEQALV